MDVPAEEERGKSAQDYGPDENPRLIRSAQQHDDGWLCRRDSLKKNAVMDHRPDPDVLAFDSKGKYSPRKPKECRQMWFSVRWKAGLDAHTLGPILRSWMRSERWIQPIRDSAFGLHGIQLKSPSCHLVRD